MMMARQPSPDWLRRLAPLDWLALTGGVINLLVSLTIFGWWLAT